MALAATPAPQMDLIVLAFLAGFAAASLVFWPLLHRAHQRLNAAGRSSSGATRVGKHALRAEGVARSTPAQPTPGQHGGSAETGGAVTGGKVTGAAATAEAGTSSATTTDGTAAENTHPEGDASGTPSAAEHALPAQRLDPDDELAEVPQLPTDLFEQQFQAKFERTRKRIARLRTQLNSE